MVTHQAVAPNERAAMAAGELVTVLNDWEHATDYASRAWLLYLPNRVLPAKLRVWIAHLAVVLGGESGYLNWVLSK